MSWEEEVDFQVYCVECQELSEQTGNEGFIYTAEQPYYVLYGMFSHAGARGWVRLGRLGPVDAQALAGPPPHNHEKARDLYSHCFYLCSQFLLFLPWTSWSYNYKGFPPATCVFESFLIGWVPG